MLDSWTKERVKSLRLRLGWSCSDLARRLKCSGQDLISFEEGKTHLPIQLKSELEIIEKQANLFSEELQSATLVENALEEKALSQIEFSRVKGEMQS